MVARTAQIQPAGAGEEASPQQPEFRPGRGPTDWLGGWRTGLVAPLILLAVAIGLRVYQQFYSWTAGLDSSSHAFTLYWRTVLVGGLLGVGIFTLIWWGWLIRTGAAIAHRVSHNEEVRRIAVFWGLVGATSVCLYIEASFFPNQDGAWHQTAVRDTAFTPSHIPMFYIFFPLGITMTIGTYLYGRTRLPNIYGARKGFPWSFALLIAASVTEMGQVAMNEWGHSLWIPEEFFAAPFHWPFVFYGWLAAGIFALWAETLIRLLGIEGEADAGKTGSDLEEAA
jgi:methane/ammonia monooxygenase subunit C